MDYEVEIRAWMDDIPSIWKTMPFLNQLEWKKEKWQTSMFGRKIFEAGELLRISKIGLGTHSKFFLGWKSVDKGNVANIREELGEEITNGIINSTILKTVGLHRTDFRTSDQVVSALAEYDLLPFMTFSGENIVAKDTEKNISFKIMQCNDINFNLLIETEKTAESLDEAFQFEKELIKFARQNKIENRIVHEEPPTLLYLKNNE